MSIVTILHSRYAYPSPPLNMYARTRLGGCGEFHIHINDIHFQPCISSTFKAKNCYYVQTFNKRDLIMAKFEERVKELVEKHPNLTKDEAVKIVTDKNERKKKKRAEKSDKASGK